MSNSPQKPHLGYVLRVFPSLTQTFVRNEIRALERLGYRITVLALMPPPIGADKVTGMTSGRGRIRQLADISSPSFPELLFWQLRRHPLRLLNLIIDLLRARDSYLWGSFIRAMMVSRMADLDRVDHLHAHLTTSTDTAWLVHRLTGRSFSFTVHSGNAFVPRKSRFLPRQLPAADFVVTVCESNKAILRDNAPGAADKIHVVRPFLSRELLFEPPPRIPAAPEGPFRLVSVSRLVPKKGVDVLIRALGLLVERRIAIQTTIIGNGPERARLEALIKQLGLQNKVELPGATGADEVRTQLANADCFVLASIKTPNGDSDATPTVLGEAMAVGIPVISTRLAGIPEIVPENAGVLVEPDNPQDLANAIAGIATMSLSARNEMGKRGQEFLYKDWNTDQDALVLDRLFQQAAAKGRA